MRTVAQETPTPTIVLVHGGASAAAYWDLLLPHLRAPALAIDLPGRPGGPPADLMELTADECSASVVADMDAAGVGDCVVVAHSSGCYFVPGIVARAAGRVRGIVLSPPCVIPEGGCGLDAMQPRYQAMNIENLTKARAEGRVFTTAGPPAKPEWLRDAYGVTLTDEQVAFMAAPERNPKDSVNFYSQPVFWSAARDVPVVAVRQLRDPITPLALQDEMIARLPSPDLVEVVSLDTGHIPAVTDVDAFAAIVNGLIQRVG